MTTTQTLDFLSDALLVRKVATGDNYGAGKEGHGAVGLYANGNLLMRYCAKVAEPDWTGVKQIVSATGRVKARQSHSSLGSNPRFYVRRLTGNWSQGVQGENAWNASNAVVYPGPAGQSGSNLIDSGDLGAVAAASIVEFDLTEFYEKVAPATVLKSDGVTPCEGLTNYGLILVSYDTGSHTRYLEFDSVDGVWPPRVTMVTVDSIEPSTPVFTTLSGVNASQGMWTTDTTPDLVITAQDADDTDCAAYDWSLYDMTSFTDVASGTNVTSGISGMVISKTLPTLTAGHQYQFNISTQDPSGLWSPWGHLTFSVVQAPTAALTDPASAGIVAHITMQTESPAWSTPRLVVAWSHTDPGGLAQNAYRVKVYTDSGGSPVGYPGSPDHDTGVVASAEKGPITLTYDLGNGSFYHITVETRNTAGVWSAQSATRRVRVRWARAAYVMDTGGGTVTSWSFAHGETGAPTNSAVHVEVASNSSASAPSSYKSNTGEVAIQRYFHYRVWLMAWGSASPTSPSFDFAKLTYQSDALTCDGWALDTGAGIDRRAFVYGTQCLRIDGVAGNTGRAATQGRVDLGQPPITLQPDTDYTIHAFIQNVGDANGRVYVIDQSFTNILFSTPTMEDDTAGRFVHSVSDAYRTGSAPIDVFVLAWMDGLAGTAALFDALKLEASRVATPWTPGFVGRGVAVDAGGLQVDGANGAVFRLRAADGTKLELGANGLTGDAVIQTSGDILSGDDIYLVDGLRWTDDAGATTEAEIDNPSTGTLRVNDGAGGAVQFNVVGNVDISGAYASQSILHSYAMLNADLTANPSSFSDVTGLTCAVTNGREYAWEAWGTHAEANVNTGVSLGFNHPGGTCSSWTEIYPGGATSAVVTEFNAAVNTNGGTNTNTGTGSGRYWHMRGTYQCTADGTFAIRYQRNGTSANVTIGKGSILVMHSVA